MVNVVESRPPSSRSTVPPGPLTYAHAAAPKDDQITTPAIVTYVTKRVSPQISIIPKISPSQKDSDDQSSSPEIFYDGVQQSIQRVSPESQGNLVSIQGTPLYPRPNPTGRHQTPHLNRLYTNGHRERYTVVQTCKIWNYNYNVYMQLDGGINTKEVCLVTHGPWLKNLVVDDEISIHFMENPDLLTSIISLIRRGPRCGLKVCARGYVEGLFDFMSGPLTFTKCTLIDLCSDWPISFKRLLSVLRNATHIEVDLNGFLIESDVGKMLKNWNREPTIVEFILHNVPKLANESCIQEFLSKMMVRGGYFRINWSDAQVW